MNFGRALAVSGFLALALIYSILWLQTIRDPGLRTGSDFIAFYTAGRIANQFGAAHVYDVSLQQNIQQAQVGFSLAPGQVLLYNHLPYLIPILQLIAVKDYVTSFILWDVLLLALYALTMYLLTKTLDWDAASSVLAFIGGLTFFPAFVSLLNGQDSAFLVLGVALCLYFLARERDLFAGLGLALVTVRPQIAILLVIPFLFKRRKVLIGFGIGASLLAMVSMVMLGLDGTKQFIDFLLLTTNGEWYGIKESAMFNLIGILTRAAPTLNPQMIRLTGWIAYTLAALILGWFAFKASSVQSKHLGMIVIASLFFAPHLHYHDLALLLIPVFAFIGIRKWPFLPLIVSTILLIGFAPELRYWIAYLVMASLALMLFSPEKTQLIQNQFQSLWRKR
ncbi:MAG TPA: glycosyltransferase family 87 protein [Anaerolineales bacterium]|nr:glycosyltransferase family 87 protein [Anaerolineales bacterium]